LLPNALKKKNKRHSLSLKPRLLAKLLNLKDSSKKLRPLTKGLKMTRLKQMQRNQSTSVCMITNSTRLKSVPVKTTLLPRAITSYNFRNKHLQEFRLLKLPPSCKTCKTNVIRGKSKRW
jgi:hypothetical protein